MGVSGGRTGATSQPDVEHEVQVETKQLFSFPIK